MLTAMSSGARPLEEVTTTMEPQFNKQPMGALLLQDIYIPSLLKIPMFTLSRRMLTAMNSGAKHSGEVITTMESQFNKQLMGALLLQDVRNLLVLYVMTSTLSRRILTAMNSGAIPLEEVTWTKEPQFNKQPMGALLLQD